MSFDGDAQTLQYEEANEDAACTVQGQGYHQDDQNGHTLMLSPGWEEEEIQTSFVLEQKNAMRLYTCIS